jgi:predicted Zn finger-like uncharacterized protein
LILTCENCSRRYSVAEEMVRGKAIKLRCKGCQQLITVPAASGSGASAKSSAPPVARASNKKDAAAKDAAALSDGLSAVTRIAEGESWFAMIKGRQTGPLLSRDLAGRFKAGAIGRRTYVWREGMADWKRAEDVAELLPIFEPEKWVPAPAEEVSVNHRRESFEELAVTNPVVQGRPLPGLKLSREMLAASPQPRWEDGEEPRREPTPSGLTPLVSGEETGFFIAKAGMNKRNPPWKIAAFAIALIVLPLSVLYLLTAFKLGPLMVTRVDSSGREFKESVFASGGVSGLGDLLAGRKGTAPMASGESRPGRIPPKAPAAAPKPEESPPSPPPSPSPRTASSADLRALYADASKGDVRPTVRKQSKEKKEDAAGGLGQAEVAKVVSQTQPGFRFCIEQEMKKNPSFRGGKIFIHALVGTSGTVKQAVISRPEIDSSSLGQCLKSKARRMVFAAFSGDDTEVQIPLILTTSL